MHYTHFTHTHVYTHIHTQTTHTHTHTHTLFSLCPLPSHFLSLHTFSICSFSLASSVFCTLKGTHVGTVVYANTHTHTHTHTGARTHTHTHANTDANTLTNLCIQRDSAIIAMAQFVDLLKGLCVVLETKFRTQKCNIYNVNEVITQTQKYPL